MAYLPIGDIYSNSIPSQIDPDKVTMGLGFYDRSFTLTDPDGTSAGCCFNGGGNSGNFSQSAGKLTFSEIQDVISAGAKMTFDDDAAVKSVVWDLNQWVSYDD